MLTINIWSTEEAWYSNMARPAHLRDTLRSLSPDQLVSDIFSCNLRLVDCSAYKWGENTLKTTRLTADKENLLSDSLFGVFLVLIILWRNTVSWLATREIQLKLWFCINKAEPENGFSGESLQFVSNESLGRSQPQIKWISKETHRSAVNCDSWAAPSRSEKCWDAFVIATGFRLRLYLSALWPTCPCHFVVRSDEWKPKVERKINACATKLNEHENVQGSWNWIVVLFFGELSGVH